ncbi:Uncharacterized protein ALO82_00078 [Pseudomonas syringae pv. broussonetiae]|nr:MULTISPECIES: DUF3742 family protein [Pseudomonas syringae group]KPW49321.1 Uncharacterized protein ALO82_00078 [Pseudomonas syringae pv. broussonetiae]KPW24739.1 hypothetical protein ALO83_102271 [Pseudomonas cannabina pv. alisalensis]KPW81300.1 Uncharacterized protein ALO76_04152 [Pseudomonas syringae pv. coriandricola]KWT13447.1 hypothetical protein AL047_10550 [Pseudomonas syringae pv. broussonetiae]MBM0142367.1 DUF3742 family protein [Pseudomonas cannabina pv. alisalensis]
MTTDANTDLSGAARFGHVLGRGLRRILNVERAFWSLFDRTGVPRVIITPVKWGARAAVFGTGAFFVAWGLLYALGVVAILGVILGILNTSATCGALNRSLAEEELPYGIESNVFGQTKGWFDSDNEYR